MKTSSLRAWLITALVLFNALLCTSQDLDDVTIFGKVVDSNAKPIPGAAVTATDVNSNSARTGIADDEGRYRLIKLKPGTYRITTNSVGFGAKETEDLHTL